MAEIAVRLIIGGKVQGVGYRVFVVQEARQRHVRGWVRNRRDGTVEALLIGAGADVDALVAACRRGPRHARVADLSQEPGADDGTPHFHERPTV